MLQFGYGTTIKGAAHMGIKITPRSGETTAQVVIIGCTIEAIDGDYIDVSEVKDVIIAGNAFIKTGGVSMAINSTGSFIRLYASFEDAEAGRPIDFSEDDEPAAKIEAAYEHGEKGTTRRGEDE